MFLRVEKESGWTLKLDNEIYNLYVLLLMIVRDCSPGIPNSKKCTDRHSYISKDWESDHLVAISSISMIYLFVCMFLIMIQICPFCRSTDSKKCKSLYISND